MLNSASYISFILAFVSIECHALSKDNKMRFTRKKTITEPTFSRGDSTGEKLIKAYQYGQDLIDDEDTMITTDELLENVKDNGSKKSYLCKDYSVCVKTAEEKCKGALDQCSADTFELSYWKELAEAAIDQLIIKEYENDKSIMNAEMYANLVTGGDRSIKAHIRAAKSVVGDFIGMDTYREALNKQQGSSYFRKMKKDRENRKSNKLDCDGADEGSLKCSKKSKSYSKVYDHSTTMSWRGKDALEAVDEIVDDM